MQPIIAHIDMNSYFATCEQQDNLSWRDKPVGVCEHLGGIIIAASVQAKRWGIKTGTPVWEARRLYPKIILTKTNPERYRFYTARFLKVFADYTDDVEKYSIDEAFLDLTRACNIRIPGKKDGISTLVKVNPWEEGKRIALEIKSRMKKEVGDYITCSVGLSYSKLVAKIASDLQKPDGLVLVRPEDKPGLYKRLRLTDIPGIGNRMERRLRLLGITTLSQLRDYPPTKLVAHFGIYGYHLHSMGQLEGSWKEGFGWDDSSTMRSIGHMYTIPEEFRRQRVMRQVLYKLCEMVGARLRVNEVMGNVAYVHLRDANHLGVARGGKVGYYMRDGRDIYKEALRLLESTGADLNLLDRQIYRVGITVAGLVPYENQENLFSIGQPEQLLSAMDKINAKYDDFTIARVPAFLARGIIRDSVGFGRMKEFKTTFLGGSQGRFA